MVAMPPSQLSPPAQEEHATLSPPSPSSPPRSRYTSETAAGRAKLHIDDENWDAAEKIRHHRLRSERSKYDWSQQVHAHKADDASRARDRSHVSLLNTRARLKAEFAARGREGRAQAEERRRQRNLNQTAWDESTRQLREERGRIDKTYTQRQIEQEKVLEASARRIQKHREEHDIVKEFNERLSAKQERAERIRRHADTAPRIVSSADLRRRQAEALSMRRQEYAREALRKSERLSVQASAKVHHDEVLRTSSPKWVARSTTAVAHHRAADAAEVRRSLDRMALERLQARAAELARKKELHDAVRRAAIEGNVPSSDFLGNPLMCHPPPSSPSREVAPRREAASPRRSTTAERLSLHTPSPRSARGQQTQRPKSNVTPRDERYYESRGSWYSPSARDIDNEDLYYDFCPAARDDDAVYLC